jgi:translocation and assembly module TamB
VRVRYPEGVSTVANADLRLAGTAERSTVTGAITILRTGFNPQSDFSSIIAKSAEPVRTPPARAGLLGGMNFDVQIETAPDIQFQSSLTQDLQVEANLRLRGNATNPGLLGRINITQGQLVFFGARYNINQGSVAFYNPLKIDPILDIDLETKARGIDVTLTVPGRSTSSTSRRARTRRSSSTIVAVGYRPCATSPRRWRPRPRAAGPADGRLGAAGQAIASPVAGRLQRFLRNQQLRIDHPARRRNQPAGAPHRRAAGPRDITITYITASITQSVRVEWSVTRHWSSSPAAKRTASEHRLPHKKRF